MKRKTKTKNFSLGPFVLIFIVILVIAIFALSRNNEEELPPEEITDETTTTVYVRVSNCPIAKQLKELISKNAESTWGGDGFKIPFGDVSRFFSGADFTTVQGYKLGFSSEQLNKWYCTFPPEYFSNGDPRTFELSCKIGSEIGENENYIYCKRDVLYHLLIGRDVLNQQGILEKTRSMVSNLVIDYRDFTVIELQCEKIDC